MKITDEIYIVFVDGEVVVLRCFFIGSVYMYNMDTICRIKMLGAHSFLQLACYIFTKNTVVGK